MVAGLIIPLWLRAAGFLVVIEREDLAHSSVATWFAAAIVVILSLASAFALVTLPKRSTARSAIAVAYCIGLILFTLYAPAYTTDKPGEPPLWFEHTLILGLFLGSALGCGLALARGMASAHRTGAST